MLPPQNIAELTFPTEAMDYTDVVVVPEHDKEGLEPMISSLQAKVLALRLKERSLGAQRREALNRILDIKGSIRVFCRVRPSFKEKHQTSLSINEEKITVRSVGGARKEFAADRVFTEEATQVEVFHEVEHILRSALDGHNVCIFAYGQTGTGKTFTMEGTTDQPGIVPRSVKELFRQASEDKSSSFTFSMSMLEVYMGSLRDLLAQKQSSSRSIHYSTPKCGLNILSGSNGSVEVEGLTDVPVSDFKEAYRWYAKGKRSRSTSWTNVNESSSRSHCLTRITISRSAAYTEGGNRAVAKLWMVDLGGSERLLKTGAIGQTLDEGKAINLSLSALADVIASLKKRRNHIPYRNSKLTQILSDSLGDGSKVLMIVHISPSEDDLGETICSLSFAKRVRAIEPSRELSEDLKKHKEKRITDLIQQTEETEVELRKVKNQIESTEKLIQEKKLLFPIHRVLEDQKGSPRSPLIIYHGKITETPRTSDKARPSSVPHFMTSTECSRQRSTAAAFVNRTSRTPSLVSRIPVELTGSQSLSYSETCFKPNPQRLKSKSMACEANSPTCNSINSKMSPLSRNTKVSTLHPILRVTMHHHRRRMSELT